MSAHDQVHAPVPSSMNVRVPINAEWRHIMDEGLFSCFSDAKTCTFSCLFPCCVAGANQEKIGSNCCANCFLHFLCCGCQRSNIQKVLGVPDQGCFIGCLVHAFCGCCALAQESRALNAWVVAGKPTRVPVPKMYA